uniref:Putative secreted protein n=1 Tax=Anopheles darlingi TaxID=43151 RepID=A0A2M4DR45_ANODA
MMMNDSWAAKLSAIILVILIVISSSPSSSDRVSMKNCKIVLYSRVYKGEMPKVKLETVARAMVTRLAKPHLTHLFIAAHHSENVFAILQEGGIERKRERGSGREQQDTNNR